MLRKEKPYEQEAKTLYAQCLHTVRQPFFYTDYGVDDSMEARFDLLTLHCFLIINRTLAEPDFDAKPLNQTLFDIMFADMDQTMREMGIGDMGIPKRMKKMMTGFNGRMHSYESACAAQGNAALTEAINRNIYAGASPDHAKKLAHYTKKQQKHLKALPIETILKAESLFTHE
jgi:cytochrome b pre-mRNA-processing protein 3